MMNALDRTQMLKFKGEYCSVPGICGDGATGATGPAGLPGDATNTGATGPAGGVTSIVAGSNITVSSAVGDVTISSTTLYSPAYIEIVFTLGNGAQLTASSPVSGIGASTLPASYNVSYSSPNIIITNLDASGSNAWKLGFVAVVSQYAMTGVYNPTTIAEWNTHQAWQSCFLTNTAFAVGTIQQNAISIPFDTFSKLYLSTAGTLIGAVGDGNPYVLGRLYFLTPFFS